MLENEESIIKAAQENATSFGIIFDEYYNSIFNYVLRRVANPFHSRDIVSEVFYNALCNISRFQWRGISILNWLYRIANNEIAQFFRSPGKKVVSLDRLKDLNVQFASNTNLEKEMLQAEEALEQHEEFLKIQAQICELSLKYQEVISLRYFEGKKLSEIAEIIGKNENTTKALLYRGLEKLKK